MDTYRTSPTSIMAAARKMDELLVSWLGSDSVYESIIDLIENYRRREEVPEPEDTESTASPRNVIIPPFYPKREGGGPAKRRRRTPLLPYESWDPVPVEPDKLDVVVTCVRDLVAAVFADIGQDPPLTSPSSVLSEEGETEEERLSRRYITADAFVRITKDICRFPSFFNQPLYQRILLLWNAEQQHQSPMEVVTFDMLEWYWRNEMEPYDASDRFFRLVKQPNVEYIERDDFLPFIKALLADHPGLEFLSSHAEFQDKYAVTVITRIFYQVNRCHSGKITARQIRRSQLLEAFHQVDEEEDINKVTRFLSYEHFYVLYWYVQRVAVLLALYSVSQPCLSLENSRFWELDHDRDYRISREDLLKYGDHSLSHMIVDRIFDAAPRPFEQERPNRDFLTYESFIYFMLSEEDKSNEVSVRYWFTCCDVDGDGKLNNMEMRSFYAVQLHRMQCMGQEIVGFDDMLCQMVDMIKPANPDYFVVEDFLQPECAAVSGALFDALFNLNKYLLFEQRDPFVERQKREDEFECDWDRFACIDYNRLAMEEEAREEEAMEIDWVTVDEDDEHGGGGGGGTAGGPERGEYMPQGGPDPSGTANEAPF